MTEQDSYICEICGDEFYFSDAYDEYIDKNNFKVYLINGWHGSCDGQEMCDSCWDSY